ncbi:hypothetical protein OQA88_8859 [Cercophora sp. LCS_1]
MGAEQSSTRRGAQQTAQAGERKTCYYELLGIDRQAPEEEIRRAYKKKALEHHPDRNYGDTENATRRFAEVQTAYEVLIDPQERAWYDSHRDAILSGDSDAAGGGPPSDQTAAGNTPAAAIFALMGRFTKSVPMTDSPSGFFGALNSLFDQLAAEETVAAEWEGAEVIDYPPFGKADDDYDSVAKTFYRVWSGFSTKKSFSWRDKYRLSDAPDRYVRRLMEKENKKLREDGRREFNDAVQSLVAFARKRDPRYVPNTQSEAERQKVLRDSAAQQAARSRAANLEKLAEFAVPEWAQSREDGDQDGEFSQSEEDESEVEVLECVVCNKTFKSEKQFDAHEKSKKHIKAVQQLRRQMKKEDATFDLQETGDPLPTSTPDEGEDEEDAIDTIQLATGAYVRIDPGPGGREEVKQPTAPSPSDTEDEDDEYAPRTAVEERIMPKVTTPTERAAADSAVEIDSATASVSNMTLDNEATSGKKVGKAKMKREKKAAKQAAEALESHNCAVCEETFTSRTKLFAHIKDLNHAAPIPVSRPKGSKKQKR